MRVSLNQIKQYVDIELPSIDELVTKINRQLGKVDEVIVLNDRYDGATVVRVASCEKHPNADKLNVCMVDDGSGEMTQVVCGAPNVRVGMYAVWLKPGSTVPSTAEDAEPFVLGTRELRGVMSNGMLASQKELGIGDSHDGILEITDYDLRDGHELVPGANFAELFGLNDTIIDIENKMFTHRPDLFGQLGVAREISGISGSAFKSPDWYTREPKFENGEGHDLTTFNETAGAVSRVMFMPMKNVTIKPSPIWLQCALVELGSKPINNVVDATNYIMLLTAQPTHAYDYDKIRGRSIGARMATQGETAKLLNGKTYTLNDTDIVIADGDGPVGLGGIMGGGDSEVSESTTSIVLEVATFDMYAVRKSSMRHGVFTDALTRFNKGQSPLQNPHVMSRLITMVGDLAGAEPAGAIADLYNDSTPQSGMYSEDALDITPEFINARLGLSLDGAQIAELLCNVELQTRYDADDGLLAIKRPFWRTDLELPEDIVEEVGRLYGFDKLPRELPTRSMKPAAANSLRSLKDRVRSSLRRAGANEVLTYSFVHGKLLENSGYDPEGAYKLSNAVSPDLQYYRPRVLPSLLEKVRSNIKNGYGEFALFEIGKGHEKRLGMDESGSPVEVDSIDLVYASKKTVSGAAFYNVRRLLDALADDLGVDLSYSAEHPNGTFGAFEPTRTATVTDKNTGAYIGMVGEFTSLVTKKFKLPEYAAGFMLDFASLHESAAGSRRAYQPLSRYPSVTQDISLRVPSDVRYEDVLNCIESVTADNAAAHISVTPLVIYASEPESPTKTITVRLMVTSYERTLRDDDVKPIIEQIAKRAFRDFDGQII